MRVWGPNNRAFAESGVLTQIKGLCAVNVATLRTENDSMFVDETDGGVQTRIDSGDLLRELSGYPFRFLLPGQLDEILQSVPAQDCKHQIR